MEQNWIVKSHRLTEAEGGGKVFKRYIARNNFAGDSNYVIYMDKCLK